VTALPLPAHGERAPPRIAVFTDKLDWHVDETLKAFRALGARPVAVRLSACRIDTARPHGLAIPGFRNLPDLAVVRAIGDGTLESITMRLAVLHALEALKVPLVNSARAIERCTDKSMASFLLSHAGLPTPETFATQSLEEARGVYYLQRFVGPARPPFEDMRVLVANGDVVAAMRRRSSHWVTNVRQGARPSPAEPTARERELALAAANAMGAAIAGVDLIADAGGATQVLEVNSMAGWHGLQKVTPFSIAGRLAAETLKHAAAPHHG